MKSNLSIFFFCCFCFGAVFKKRVPNLGSWKCVPMLRYKSFIGFLLLLLLSLITTFLNWSIIVHNVVSVSAVQQSESASGVGGTIYMYINIHTHTHTPSLVFLPPTLLDHQKERRAELPVLQQLPLAIYHTSGSVYVNATPSVRPTLLFPLCVHKSLLGVSIPTLQIDSFSTISLDCIYTR